MNVDAKTIVETFQAIAALFTWIGAGIEMFKKKDAQKEAVEGNTPKKEQPQKVACEQKMPPRELCYSR